MKYLLLFITFLIGWVFYLSQTNIFFMLLADSLWNNKEVITELEKPIFSKPIAEINDINGIYKFDCKKKWLTTYKNYEVGVKFKDKIIPTMFNKINRAKKGEYYIKAKVTIKDKNNSIVYIKKAYSKGGYGWLDYEQFMFIDRFNINNCSDIHLEINFVESSIKNIPNDVATFYIKVDERL